MVPFPRMHFLVPGLALPLESSLYSAYSFYSLPSITQQMFHHKNLLATCSPHFSRYFTLMSMFRSNSLSACDVETHMWDDLIFYLIYFINSITVRRYVMQTQPNLCLGYQITQNVLYLFPLLLVKMYYPLKTYAPLKILVIFPFPVHPTLPLPCLECTWEIQVQSRMCSEKIYMLSMLCSHADASLVHILVVCCTSFYFFLLFFAIFLLSLLIVTSSWNGTNGVLGGTI